MRVGGWGSEDVVNLLVGVNSACKVCITRTHTCTHSRTHTHIHTHTHTYIHHRYGGLNLGKGTVPKKRGERRSCKG